VEGGHLIEEVRIDDLQAGLEQLGADDERHHPADHEHGEAEPQVHRADVLVVGGRDPPHDAGWMMTVVVVVGVGVGDCTHRERLLGRILRYRYLRTASTSAGCAILAVALLLHALEM
jgi:hypothetical protein